MGVEAVIIDEDTGQRRAKRNRVLLLAKLQTPEGEVEARLRDLSRKGALLECAVVPPAGTEVVFSRGSTVVAARVAWASGNRLGLEFHYMIDESEVLIQLRKRSGPKQQRFRRPGLNEVLSANERKLARALGRRGRHQPVRKRSLTPGPGPRRA